MCATFLDREEYIEQAHFFRVFRERLEENVPSQEILSTVHEEILATTKLPLAIEFLRGEVLHTGKISDGMERLAHYFTPFQTFVMSRAEADRSRFQQQTALQILQREAEYMAGTPTPAALFIYQFECLARNLLGYDRGMAAMAEDPFYDDQWRAWIFKARLQLGATDFADLIYYRSDHYVEERSRATGRNGDRPSYPILFGVQEGRIAKANRGKDPLYMFAALQRQLGYPAVPRVKPKPAGPDIPPAIAQRFQRLERRLKLLESESKGDFDLSEFYAKPEDSSEKENG